MSDNMRDTLQRTMKAIVEIAPAAPPVEASDLQRNRIGRPGTGWRGPAIALTTAAAVLAVFGLTAIGTLWLRTADSTPAESSPATAAEGWVVAVFLSETVAVDEGSIEKALTDLDGVVETRYMSKAAALIEARESLFVDDAAMLQILEENPDLLPASIRVLTDSHERSSEIAGSATRIRGVVDASIYYGTIDLYGSSPEEILAEYETADTTTPATEASLVPEAVVVFFVDDEAANQIDRLIDLAGNGILSAGSTQQGTMQTRARTLMTRVDVALLDEFPGIVEPALAMMLSPVATDVQSLVDHIVSMEGVSAIVTVNGEIEVNGPALPRQAAELRSWWRSGVLKEYAATCCTG